MSFPFELRSETTFVSHVQSCSSAVFLPRSVHGTVPWTALKVSSQGHSTAAAQYYTCELKYGYLKEDTNFGFFRLPRGLSRRLLSECLSIMNWTADGVYQTKLRLSWMKRSYFGSRAWVLVKFTVRGFWQRFVKRQVLERDSTRNSRKM